MRPDDEERQADRGPRPADAGAHRPASLNALAQELARYHEGFGAERAAELERVLAGVVGYITEIGHGKVQINVHDHRANEKQVGFKVLGVRQWRNR
jgi:hypothetical protein